MSHSFHPEPADWVVVYIDPTGAAEWYAQSVVGWVELEHADGTIAVEPVPAGETLEYDACEWIYVCRRTDLALPHVKRRLHETCEHARAHRRRSSGCGAP
jgi:hypothetical protein